jgi:hypothetical protein
MRPQHIFSSEQQAFSSSSLPFIELRKGYTNINVGMFPCNASIPCTFILRGKDSKTTVFLENITLAIDLFDHCVDVLGDFTTDITLY